MTIGLLPGADAPDFYFYAAIGMACAVAGAPMALFTAGYYLERHLSFRWHRWRTLALWLALALIYVPLWLWLRGWPHFEEIAPRPGSAI